jgi:hypothetical protein
MDFNRGNAQAPASRPAQPSANGPVSQNLKTKPVKSHPKMLQIGGFVLLLCLVVIVAAIALLLALGGDSSEFKSVKQDKLQSVFLNNGQVYFGKIDTKVSTEKYLSLSNIYYLRTNSTGAATTTTASGDVSLVKLGCELHGPYDKMIINRDQVTFWENLQDSGQVAKAIAQFKQQNPNGQKCSTTASTGTQQSPSATTPSNTSGTTAAPAPTATVKSTNGQ